MSLLRFLLLVCIGKDSWENGGNIYNSRLIYIFFVPLKHDCMRKEKQGKKRGRLGYKGSSITLYFYFYNFSFLKGLKIP